MKILDLVDDAIIYLGSNKYSESLSSLDYK